MANQFQLRFEFDREDLERIIGNLELQDKLSEVLIGNAKVIDVQIKKVRNEIFSLDKKYSKLTSANKEDLLNDELFFEKFVEVFCTELIWQALNQFFKNQEYDIRENLINILDDPKIVTTIKKRIVITFISIIGYLYYNDLDEKFL